MREKEVGTFLNFIVQLIPDFVRNLNCPHLYMSGQQLLLLFEFTSSEQNYDVKLKEIEAVKCKPMKIRHC